MSTSNTCLNIIDITNYCIRAYQHFHQCIGKIIQREGESVSLDLLKEISVKFICHYGEFTEIVIQNFRKPMGLEIITAHKLLKNNVPDHEYILLTEKYLGSQRLPGLVSHQFDECPAWSLLSEGLEDIGVINYHWVSLKNLKPNCVN